MKSKSSETDVPDLVDHLFRHQSGRMVSILTRILGTKHLALAEDVVQEALIKALELWPFQGTPENPSAWLIQVAKNRALDRLRRDTSFTEKLEGISRAFSESVSPNGPAPFEDDEVSMLFLCAHPALAPEARLALTLKIVGGFGVREIARAFLAEESAIAQRLVRAKRQIREEGLNFEMPPASELPSRLESVLDVLYLMFNEGYGASRQDLCDEAIRMARILAQHPEASLPALHALLALFLLQSSRFEARLDPSGSLLLLADQDRTKWDRERISEGFYWLYRSSTGDVVTPYHLEAGIAAKHAAALDSASTDWSEVIHLYDQLYALKPSPVIALNRAVAVARIAGPRAAIEEIERIQNHPKLEKYFLVPAALGALWRELGDEDKARKYYSRALAAAWAEPEQKFLEKQLAE